MDMYFCLLASLKAQFIGDSLFSSGLSFPLIESSDPTSPKSLDVKCLYHINLALGY